MSIKQSNLSLLLEQLSSNSHPYMDPMTRIDWAKLDDNKFWLPEKSLSLYGVNEFMRLPQKQRCRLSHYEYLHLLEHGLWFEGIFIYRMAQSITNINYDIASYKYLLHELREETGHSLMYLEFLEQSKFPRITTRLQTNFLLKVLLKCIPNHSALFWICVLIAEETPDRLNRLILKESKSLCKTATDISRVHTIDEARHIVHAGCQLNKLLAPMGRFRKKVIAEVSKNLFKVFTRRFFYPPDQLYTHAGLQPGDYWSKLARNNPQRSRFVHELTKTNFQCLKHHGIDPTSH
jgi:hypothetical protein